MDHEKVSKYVLAVSAGWFAGCLAVGLMAKQTINRYERLADSQLARKQQFILRMIELSGPHIPKEVLDELVMESEFQVIAAAEDDSWKK